MIWLWIIVALILSYLPLINKRIELSNYMWLLIPVDAYGISVAGAIIKPYMIFALILPVVIYARNKGADFDLRASKGQLLLGFISVLLILVNMFNCNDISATKAAFLAFVVYICAQLYISSADCKNCEQLSDVFIASCFGCAITYLVAYMLMQNDINIGGIVAQNRSQPGMFMQLSNMSNGKYIEAYRLRGFAYDPNTMFPQFIFGISACILRIFKKFNFYYLFTIIASLLCILLSSSRMGLLCFLCAVIITSIAGISQFDSVKKKVLSAVSAIGMCAIFCAFFVSRVGQSILSSLLSTYSNRSSLTDEYGRFSIWNECVKIYWEKSPLWGVGLGQMDEYTSTSRMTHNTWLQFICECGILVGGIVLIYFISVMLIGWFRTASRHRIDPDNTSYLSLVIGYTVTIVSLSSADNITCSYLWFGALLVLRLAYTSNLRPKQEITGQLS